MRAWNVADEVPLPAVRGALRQGRPRSAVRAERRRGSEARTVDGPLRARVGEPRRGVRAARVDLLGGGRTRDRAVGEPQPGGSYVAKGRIDLGAFLTMRFGAEASQRRRPEPRFRRTRPLRSAPTPPLPPFPSPAPLTPPP